MTQTQMRKTKQGPALLLFDIDGTLLLSGGAGMRAMRRAGEAVFGETFVWDGIEPSGMLDTLIYAEAAALNDFHDHASHHDTFHAVYLEQLAAEFARPELRVEVMPGVLSLLAKLQKRVEEQGDVVLGVLTGNYAGAAAIKLSSAGIDHDWFTIRAFAEDGPDRRSLVAAAMDQYDRQFGHRPDPRRVMVIGDTPKDVDCAKAHGCVALAVATGIYDMATLQATHADHVVEDLSDPGVVLGLLDG